MEPRERVARTIDPAIWSWEPDVRNVAQMVGHAARRHLSLIDADAAIAAVLDALQVPSEGMIRKGAYQVSGLRHEGARCVWHAMLATFRAEALVDGQ